MKVLAKLLLMTIFILLASCNKETNSKANTSELNIYTSMYKDTIADIRPQLKKEFPGIKFNFYQAGSEKIAAKVNGEIMAGGVQADILISSDRFWYEEMAANGKLHSFKNKNWDKIANTLKHAEGFYSTVSIPVMVLAYNKEAIKENEIPKTFKELSLPKYKDKFTTGSPLTSGTNFTTMAMLQFHYGWDYFKKLKKNKTIAQGGNSAVIRRLQSKERPIGWVLLENLLRFQGKDDRLKIIYPDDGVVTHANVMAITKKSESRELAQKFVNWMYSRSGQEAMTRSYMYSPLSEIAPPKGAPLLKKIMSKSFPWTHGFLKKVTASRTELKEKYTEIMFQ